MPGSPPLTRELLSFDTDHRKYDGITPAYAGTTTWQRVKSALDWDHPRLRGNYAEKSESRLGRIGSPPLTRELRAGWLWRINTFGITPAYAGTTTYFMLWNTPTQDHPRLRGNYTIRKCIHNLRKGSPPLTRELRNHKAPTQQQTRITPAYAGTTANMTNGAPRKEDHPRLRGNYCRYKCFRRYRQGSPPLTRELVLLPCGLYL